MLPLDKELYTASRIGAQLAGSGGWIVGSSEATGLDLYSITEQRLTKRIICAVSTGIGIKIPPEHFGLIKE